MSDLLDREGWVPITIPSLHGFNIFICRRFFKSWRNRYGQLNVTARSLEVRISTGGQNYAGVRIKLAGQDRGWSQVFATLYSDGNGDLGTG